MTTAHRTATTALLVLSLAATGVPMASAQSAGAAHHPPAVYSRQDKSLLPSSDSPQAVVRITSPDGGFDWGDAGIGAAGGVAIAMLGLGGALAVSQRRPRRTRQTTSLS
jgi:hypothetical protein